MAPLASTGRIGATPRPFAGAGALVGGRSMSESWAPALAGPPALAAPLPLEAVPFTTTVVFFAAMPVETSRYRPVPP